MTHADVLSELWDILKMLNRQLIKPDPKVRVKVIDLITNLEADGPQELT